MHGGLDERPANELQSMLLEGQTTTFIASHACTLAQAAIAQEIAREVTVVVARGGKKNDHSATTITATMEKESPTTYKERVHQY